MTAALTILTILMLCASYYLLGRAIASDAEVKRLHRAFLERDKTLNDMARMLNERRLQDNVTFVRNDQARRRGH